MYQNILISCNYTVIWPNILTVYRQWSHLKKKKKVIFLFQLSTIFQNIFEAFMLFLIMLSIFSMLAKFYFFRLEVIFEKHSEPTLLNKVAASSKQKHSQWKKTFLKSVKWFKDMAYNLTWKVMSKCDAI